MFRRTILLIAIGLACNPRILLADEPTTALDVTIQAQIVALMKRINQEHGTAIILVTHEPDIAAYSQRTIKFLDGKIISDLKR